MPAQPPGQHRRVDRGEIGEPGIYVPAGRGRGRAQSGDDRITEAAGRVGTGHPDANAAQRTAGDAAFVRYEVVEPDRVPARASVPLHRQNVAHFVTGEADLAVALHVVVAVGIDQAALQAPGCAFVVAASEMDVDARNEITVSGGTTTWTLGQE